MNPEEQQLINRIKTGDKEAFEALIDRLYSKLLDFTSRIVATEEEAQDVVQNIFLKIWSHPEKWNPRIAIESYMFRTAMNDALKLKRSKRYHEDVNKLESMQSSDNQPDKILDQKELDTIIEGALDALPEKYRIPFILSRFLNFKYKEIAEILETSEKAVEKRIGQALRILKENLEPYFDPEFFKKN